VIGYKVVCDVRNTSDFKPAFLRLSLVHCSFKGKILSNGVDLLICTWFVFKHIKTPQT